MTVDYHKPDGAGLRTDLTFLRRRSMPVRQVNSTIADFVAGHASAHARTEAPAPAQQSTQQRHVHQPAVRQAPVQQPPVQQRPSQQPAASQTARHQPTEPRRAATPAPDSLDLFAPQPTSPQPTPPMATSRSAADTSLDLSGPPAAPAAAPTQSSSGSLLDLSAPTPAAPAPSAPAPRSNPAPRPAANTSLDLGAPPAPPAPRSSPPAPRSSPSTSLDLGAAPITTPGRSAAPATNHPSTSLDLSPSAPPTPNATGGRVGTAPPASTTARPSTPGWPEPRTRPGVPTILTPQTPSVTLTRVQSGVGSLEFEAAAAGSVGDLRLGCVYQLRSGRSSTIQHNTGRRYAPPEENRRPILLAARQEYERLSVDLRQVTDLERLAVYAFSGNGQQLRWGGTLIASTFGGDRIEMPIELPPSDAIAVLATVYNIKGQLVLRSEMDLVGTTIREACRGYGFDRITWLDDATPVD